MGGSNQAAGVMARYLFTEVTQADVQWEDLEPSMQSWWRELADGLVIELYRHGYRIPRPGQP